MKNRQVHILGKEGVQKIYVFSGEKSIDKNDATAVPTFIYDDDSVLTIRSKISHYAGILFEDMHLYCRRDLSISIDSLYSTMLSYSGTDYISSTVMRTFYKNLFDARIPVVKNEYYYDDLENLFTDDLKISDTIGVQIKSPEFNELPSIVINPYLYDDADVERLNECKDYVSSNLNDVLFNLPDVIYVVPYCNIDGNLQNNKTYIKCLFPYLHGRNITSRKSYDDEDKIRREMMDYINKPAHDSIDKIHAGIDKTTTRAIDQGVSKMFVYTYTPKCILLNLSNIFKGLHASETTPFIEYYISNHSSMYRIFSNCAIKSTLVPKMAISSIRAILKRTPINQCIRSYGNVDDSTCVELQLRTSSDAIILVTSNNGSLIQDDVFDRIHTYVNDLYGEVRKMFVMPAIINSISNSNCDNINYQWAFKVDDIKITTIKERIMYFKDVFIFSSIDSDTYTLYGRYKRVGNFSEKDSIDSDIITLINCGIYSIADVIARLSNRYDLSRDDATARVKNIINGSEFVSNKRMLRKRRIRTNPGFEMSFELNSFAKTLTVKTMNIREYAYIKEIDGYLRLFVETLTHPEKHQKLLKFLQNRVDSVDSISTSSDVHSKSELIINDMTNDDVQNIRDIDDPANRDEFNQFMELISIAKSDESEQKEEVKSESIDSLDRFLDSIYHDDGGTTGLFANDEHEGFLLASRATGVVNDPVVATDTHGLAGGGKVRDDDLYDFDIRKFSLHPNPVYHRLVKSDPELFETKGKQTYAQSCQWNGRKQPIVMNEKEMDFVRKNHRDAYLNEIKYRGFYYICPRFYSLKHNVPLTEAQAKSGAYGYILPKPLPLAKKQKLLDPDTNIIEFVSRAHFDNNKRYIQKSPGLMSPSKHPSGLCMPCCVTSFDGKEQIRRRKSCIEQEEMITSTRSNYILSPIKSATSYMRYSYLSPELSTLLSSHMKDRALLRYGVNKDFRTDSFMAALSNIHSEGRRIDSSEMRGTLINAITLDVFVAANNGSLVQIFSEDRSTGDPDSEASLLVMKPYRRSATYGNMIKKSRYVRQTLLMMCASCTKFKSYLSDDKNDIGYQYLWDIVCHPNPNLFPSGVNLIVIRKRTNLDITTDALIVCPINHRYTFDRDRPCIILHVNQKSYEPIYLVKVDYTQNIANEHDIMRQFDVRDAKISNILDPIIKIIEKRCQLKSPATYIFKRPVDAKHVANAVIKQGHKVLKQLVHRNGTVLGLVVEGFHGRGVLPTAPSALDSSVPVDAMEFKTPVWRGFHETYKFLSDIAKSSSLPCTPKVKVLERGLIVGLITETDQFVPIAEPEQNVTINDMHEIDGYNYINVDNLETQDIDDDEKVYLNIKIETLYYKCFRRLLNNELMKNSMDQDTLNIESLITNSRYSVKERIESLQSILTRLFGSKVVFANFSKASINALYAKVGTTSRNETSLPCGVDEGDGVVYLFPKQNLLNNKDNSLLYFERYAHELVRNPFMRSHQRCLYYANTETSYSIHDNETVLTKDDFLNMISDNSSSDACEDTSLIKNMPRDMLTKAHANMQLGVDYIITNVFGILTTILPHDSREIVSAQNSNENAISLFKLLFGSTSLERTYEDIPTIVSPADILKILYHEGKSDLFLAKNLTEVLSQSSYYPTLFDYVVSSYYVKYNLIVYFTSNNDVINSNIILLSANSSYFAMIKVSNNIKQNAAQDIRIIMIDGKSILTHEVMLPSTLVQSYKDNVYSTQKFVSMYVNHLHIPNKHRIKLKKQKKLVLRR